MLHTHDYFPWRGKSSEKAKAPKFQAADLQFNAKSETCRPNSNNVARMWTNAELSLTK